MKHGRHHSARTLWHERLTLLRPYMIVVMIVCLGYIAYFKLTDPNTLPFRNVRIIATAQHIQPARLKKIIQANLTGGFFSLNTTQMHNALLTIPWVASATIRRSWPSTLVITIVEQQPIAAWGNRALLNLQGDVFTPEKATFPRNLPELDGPSDMPKQVLHAYQKFNRQLAAIQLSIRQLILTPRLAWQMQLNNGIEVMMGRKNIEQRFTQFIDLYPKIIGKKAKKVVAVDLRYPNGLAVRWKK